MFFHMQHLLRSKANQNMSLQKIEMLSRKTVFPMESKFPIQSKSVQMLPVLIYLDQVSILDVTVKLHVIPIYGK